ncbi:MAG: hypothetical protein JWN34_5140 [Bryobacterales bacterium]|nr:hypothetical protein [Bryobacterales bacterium]
MLTTGTFQRHALAPWVRNQRQLAKCTWVVFKDYVLVIDANFQLGARDLLPKIKATSKETDSFRLRHSLSQRHTVRNSMFADEGVYIICSEVCRGAEHPGTEGLRWLERCSAPSHGRSLRTRNHQLHRGDGF